MRNLTPSSFLDFSLPFYSWNVLQTSETLGRASSVHQANAGSPSVAGGVSSSATERGAASPGGAAGSCWSHSNRCGTPPRSNDAASESIHGQTISTSPIFPPLVVKRLCFISHSDISLHYLFLHFVCYCYSSAHLQKSRYQAGEVEMDKQLQREQVARQRLALQQKEVYNLTQQAIALVSSTLCKAHPEHNLAYFPLLSILV